MERLARAPPRPSGVPRNSTGQPRLILETTGGQANPIKREGSHKEVPRCRICLEQSGEPETSLEDRSRSDWAPSNQPGTQHENWNLRGTVFERMSRDGSRLGKGWERTRKRHSWARSGPSQVKSSHREKRTSQGEDEAQS
ncbi:unnamed protein product [Cuscuta campestris]|uniref:Uncharacterized protein n=1 Tax=Cuscuta campestris TaxID=132261 RepID=A0A484LSA2_9ASTE|nr:unnamed protein product [Cuscuta campestris]